MHYKIARAAKRIYCAPQQVRKMPFNSLIRYPFVEWAIAGAPNDPGVFALWRDGELIYYGSTQGEGATIQSCLFDHYAGRANPCTARATHYSWELSRDATRRERELLREHQAEAKRLPRCNESSG